MTAIRAALALATLFAFVLARRGRSSRAWVIARTLAALLAIDLALPALAPNAVTYLAAWCAFYAVTALGVVAVLRKDKTPETRAAYGAGVPGVSLGGESSASRLPLVARPVHATSGGEPLRPWVGILLLVAILASAAIAVRVSATMALERAAFVLALCVQLLAAGRFLARGRAPDDAQTVALLLAASSLADVAGAWYYGDPARDWQVGQVQALVTWILIAGWEIRCLIRVRRSLT